MIDVPEDCPKCSTNASWNEKTKICGVCGYNKTSIDAGCVASGLLCLAIMTISTGAGVIKGGFGGALLGFGCGALILSSIFFCILATKEREP